MSLAFAYALLLALQAAPASEPTREVLANTGSMSVAFAAREWLDVGLDVNGVTVDRVRLHQPGKLKGMFIKHDEANRGSIVVSNRTNRKVNPSVAIAILDEEGRLLAAANTGKKLTGVDPGTTLDMAIHFGGVFRYIERGHALLVTVEY